MLSFLHDLDRSVSTIKNIRNLSGHPLIAYTIRAAIESGVLNDVVCITDREECAEIARLYGAEVPSIRPESTATVTSPDFAWVNWSITELEKVGQTYDQFSILRPTSPYQKRHHSACLTAIQLRR